MPSDRKRKRSVTDGMSNAEKLKSGVDRGLICFMEVPCSAYPNGTQGDIVAVSGPKGHRRYIYNIRERLKIAEFRWEPVNRVWYSSRMFSPCQWPPEGLVLTESDVMGDEPMPEDPTRADCAA